MKQIQFRHGLKILTLSILFFVNFFAKGQDCGCQNVLITQKEFKEDSTNYENLFRKPGGAARHTKWVFLPKKYFVFLDSFLNSTDFNGVEFAFVSYRVNMDPNQQSDKKQILFMVAAAHSASDVDYDALYPFHTKTDILKTTKDSSVELSSRVKQGVSRIGPYRIFFNDPVIRDNYIFDFGFNKYTNAVYFCKKQIHQIKEFLTSKNRYNGVKLYFASYNKKIPCVNNFVSQQFTLILAPVLNEKTSAVFKDYNNFLKNRFTGDYYNHGELCPNSCPEETFKKLKK